MSFRIASQAQRSAKQPAVKKPTHYGFIKSLPCLFTGQHGVDAAHIRYGNVLYGIRPMGGAERDDRRLLPISRKFHTAQHAINEIDWWEQWGINPHVLAMSLLLNTGNEELCECILIEWRRLLKWPAV